MPDGYDETAAFAVDSFRGKCEECFGLCCVAPSFSVSPDFAIDKAAGEPCPNVRRDHRCTIHDSLRARGFNGCVAYDCLGAGQKVAQVTFGGRSWREAPHTAEQMFQTFRVARQLQQLLFSLVGAMALPQSRPLRPDLAALRDEIDGVTRDSADAIVATDLPRYRRRVDGLLLRIAGELTRAGAGRAITRRGIDLSGVDLAGAYLRGADFTNANLGGTRLAGADLRDADLTNADLTNADLAGADLARADVTGADLRHSVRLTQSQLDAAVGDASTATADPLVRPAHW
ncbi:pentapeptide repeat-containing protein [Dactylosporangium fulvum]|uniref:Pentapeptide repeat-containing protein n=1 Tax=Dactylosporangium fulvum TaxID=53359 RepID=A0ABY5W8N9_9ACTN|nr:pentapeptide repeat-containing protein [Dactylosporangium fulvum]UWP85579.1 pentapeptide repeat-containing protein [Dactylosporangium fulvum]